MRCLSIFLIFAYFAIVSCSSSKQAVVAAKPVEPSKTEQVAQKQKVPVLMDSAELLRLEIAHNSYLRALALESHGENELAEPFMQHAYEADPNNRFLAFAVLELMDKRGATAEALKFAEKIKPLKGKETSNQDALLGRIYAENSNIDSALAYYKKTVDASDQDLHAVYEYSLLLEIVQNKEELMRVYGILLPQIGYQPSMLNRQIALLAEAHKDSALVDLFGDVYALRGDRVFLENKSRMLFRMKRYEEALPAIEEFRADTAFTDDSLAVSFLIADYKAMNRDSAAIDTLRACYKRHPDWDYALLNLAMLEAANGMKDQARAHWNRLEDSQKYSAIANRMMSAYAMDDKDTVKAIKYLEKAYEKDPSNYALPLANLNAAYGKFDKAFAILEKEMQPNPAEDSVRKEVQASGDLEKLREFEASVAMGKAQIQYEYGKYLQMQVVRMAPNDHSDSAKALLRKSNEHLYEAQRIGGDAAAPIFLLELNFMLELNYTELDEVDSVIAVGKKMFEKYPQDPVSKNHVGYILVDKNRNAKEVAWGDSLIDEALKLDPVNYAYWDSKAWALYRQGKFEDALKAMEKSKALADSLKSTEILQDTSMSVHFGAIFQALKQNERAVESYQKVLEIDPKNANAKKQIEILKEEIAKAKPAEVKTDSAQTVKPEAAPAEAEQLKTPTEPAAVSTDVQKVAPDTAKTSADTAKALPDSTSEKKP